MESFILFDYATLRFIWWLLLGALLVFFALTDGFDLGIAALLPLVAKTDNERRVVINVVGPVWEGNQVWLITAGGAIFAAWPLLYAASFSGFYLAMLLVLVALILRPVGFKYRSKIKTSIWRSSWDAILCFSGFVAALVFGVAMGNVILGVPLGFDSISLRIIYEGNFFQLFRPFALLAGLLSVFMLTMHGASFLTIKTEGSIQERSRSYGIACSILTFSLFVIGGFWLKNLDGHVIVNNLDHNIFSNPFLKMVEVTKGAWLLNYEKVPVTCLAPIFGISGAFLAFLGFVKRNYRVSFLGSSLSISGIIISVGVSLFPFLLPSSLGDSSGGLTVWDASSSHLTLWIMSIVVVIFLPIVLAYTSWVYRVLRGIVTEESVKENPNSY
ncbi:cytochrome bd-I oxidase subunit II [Candidatus Kinetoplastibacterium desouzaii TCC079E]|uniref:Cytochrome bd-I oxidase subunit II n=1 Tax=Candidatus Kinetoplastidibacterium desouzai TCC079E TaxID=1208919 RepID=M1L373_9PROT|nr:cytochrome d ubiquinol oxidase subunit II [Candidatus Kinetoplastibacterium desouzaii]AGF47198.1 cytochrome bd-I oxidase subunit II [Candidatus Kinetoplastibacterium desouzaii TCC079E]